MSWSLKQNLLKPVPPEKGSFPLDHEGVCRDHMIKYLRCLLENNYNATECRDISKTYLNCRMDNNLMEHSDWSDLGFEDNNKKDSEKKQ